MYKNRLHRESSTQRALHNKSLKKYPTTTSDQKNNIMEAKQAIFIGDDRLDHDFDVLWPANRQQVALFFASSISVPSMFLNDKISYRPSVFYDAHLINLIHAAREIPRKKCLENMFDHVWGKQKRINKW